MSLGPVGSHLVQFLCDAQASVSSLKSPIALSHLPGLTLLWPHWVLGW